MLKIGCRFNDDVLLVSVHAAGTLTDSPDRNALGKGHGNAAGDDNIARTGEMVIRQVIHAAHGRAVNAQRSPDSALVTAGLNQGGDGGFRIDDGADGRLSIRYGFGISDECAGKRDSHVFLNAIIPPTVDGEGGKITVAAFPDDGTGNRVQIFIGIHLIVHDFKLRELMLKLCGKHGLIDQLFILFPQFVVCVFHHFVIFCKFKH